MILSLVKEVFSIVSLQIRWHQRMAEELLMVMSLVLIHVLKSSYEIESSVTFQKFVIRVGDTKDSLKKKVELATILGTFQSTLTNFKYVSNMWKKNCSEERLLGVSLTGIMDSPLTNGKEVGLEELLEELREVVETNKKWAKKLGISRATAITCVKPSGTVSQLTDADIWDS